jgi:aryl-alcohol dehydrogenase-like predicted oxidoreductase
MEQRYLGRTGLKVSRLGLGTLTWGRDTDEHEAREQLGAFVEAGGTLVDTAAGYGDGAAEELLGSLVGDVVRREDVVIATKAGISRARGVRETNASRGYLLSTLDASLRRLGVDHVDLFYVHVDDRSTPLEETLEALAGLVAAGKTRYLGWSNVRTWRLERIRQMCARGGWPAPVAVQQQHSYLRRRAGLVDASIVDDEQLDYLRTHDDLTLVAYSPILKGIYDDPDKRAGHWAMEPYAGPDAQARLAAVAEVAGAVGATPNQVVLAWLLAAVEPAVIPLIGPRTLAQYEAAAAALDVKLTPDQLARLDAAGG